MITNISQVGKANSKPKIIIFLNNSETTCMTTNTIITNNTVTTSFPEKLKELLQESVKITKKILSNYQLFKPRQRILRLKCPLFLIPKIKPHY